MLLPEYSFREGCTGLVWSMRDTGDISVPLCTLCVVTDPCCVALAVWQCLHRVTIVVPIEEGTMSSLQPHCRFFNDSRKD